MSNESHQDQERDLRERIVSQIQATRQPLHKQFTAEELQSLQAAARRLDEMLNAAATADREALQAAAARLDQLLADIGKGKDVVPEFKRRQAGQIEQE